jgi:hypothetical protein
MGGVMETFARAVNSTKGRVADLERPRPPADQARGFDLTWAGFIPYSPSWATITLHPWSPAHDILITAITVITTTTATYGFDVAVKRDGIDTSAAVTHPASSVISTGALATPVAVTAGTVVAPYISCDTGDDNTSAGKPLIVILRGTTNADHRPSAGLSSGSWDVDPGGGG